MSGCAGAGQLRRRVISHRSQKSANIGRSWHNDVISAFQLNLTMRSLINPQSKSCISYNPNEVMISVMDGGNIQIITI